MSTTIQSIASNSTDVAIGGYSPVSYFEKGRAERGEERFAVVHEGRSYHMTSIDQVETFHSDPAKYVPAYGGWCAYGMSIDQKFPIDPENFKIVDGRLMVFLKNDDTDARELWNKEDERTAVEKADQSWKSK